MLIDIALWIIFGALAGWIASIIMRTNAEQGAVMNIVVGILGAFIGGLLMRMLTGETMEGFSFTSFLVAVLGAIILLAIVKMFRRGGSPHRV